MTSTHVQMMARLAERTAKLNPGGSGDRPNTVPPGLPVPAPTPRLWDTPVTHEDGTGYVLSTCGRFSIVKEKAPGGHVYRLFSRLPPVTLLGSHPNLKAAQNAANEVPR